MKLILPLLVAASICHPMNESDNKKLNKLQQIDCMIKKINKTLNDFDPEKSIDFSSIIILEQELQTMYQEFKHADK